MAVESPVVTVIVPAFNQPDRLRTCLAALERQSYPADRFEVIVVDNASEPPLAEIVKAAANVRIVVEPMMGSYAARNCGVRQARGEIIAFTDSDCIPAPDWLERGTAAMTSMPGCGLLAGRIEVIVPDDRAPTAAELYDQLTAFPQRAFLEGQHFGATANVFTRRQVFEAVGEFHTAQSSGDLEWGRRVHAAGYAQKYDDDVVVRHPARTRREILGKAERIAAGTCAMVRQGRLRWTYFAWVFATSALPPVDELRAIVASDRIRGAHTKAAVAALAVRLRYLRFVQLGLFALGLKSTDRRFA